MFNDFNRLILFDYDWMRLDLKILFLSSIDV